MIPDWRPKPNAAADERDDISSVPTLLEQIHLVGISEHA
jgi:hypothetical protein